jgi:uncharacterized protein YjdB
MSRPKRLLHGAALLAVPLLLAACSPKPVEIRVKESRIRVFGLGRTLSVTGNAVDSKGEIVPGATVTWESSNPKVATVDATTGSVKSVATGKAVVTARLAEPPLEAQVVVEVFDVALANVVPSRTTLAGPAGTTYALNLEVKDSGGKRVELPATWTSSAPNVAKVDAAGVVTSVGEGTASLRARVGDVDATADVVVVFRPIETLEATPLNIPLKVGEIGVVTLVARDPAGAPIPDVAATWTSSDPLVATCSAGKILGIGPGSATIRAACGAKSAEVSVIVF